MLGRNRTASPPDPLFVNEGVATGDMVDGLYSLSIYALCNTITKQELYFGVYCIRMIFIRLYTNLVWLPSLYENVVGLVPI